MLPPTETTECVVAVDPGGTTGWAVFLFSPNDVEYVEHGHWGDPDQVWHDILSTLERYRSLGYRVTLVVEQFDKRPGIVNPDFTPKFVSRDIVNNIHGYDIVWQIPAAAMNLVKPAGKRNKGPDQLKRFGWYHTNSVHANDAARHAIVYAVEKLKHKPTILRGWPRKDDH